MWTRRRAPRAPKVPAEDKAKLDRMAVVDLQMWVESCLMNAQMCFDDYRKSSNKDFIVASIDYTYEAQKALDSLAGR